jgi:hypothetical protein
MAATNVLFPHQSLADHSLLAETETWAIIAAENRACCPGLRIDKSAMKMLCPQDLPFTYRATAALGADAVFRCEMFGEQSVRLGQLFKQRQAPRITLSRDESGLHKGLPGVRVEQQVADRAFAEVIGDSPIGANAFSGFASIFKEWPTGSSDEPYARWQDKLGDFRRIPAGWLGLVVAFLRQDLKVGGLGCGDRNRSAFLLC